MKTEKLNHLCYQLQEGNVDKNSEWVSLNEIPPDVIAERKSDGKRVTLLEVIADYEKQLMNYKARDAQTLREVESIEFNLIAENYSGALLLVKCLKKLLLEVNSEK